MSAVPDAANLGQLSLLAHSAKRAALTHPPSGLLLCSWNQGAANGGGGAENRG